MKKILCLAAGLLALASMPAIAADDYTTTAGGTTRTFRAKDVGAGKLMPYSIPTDATGVAYGTGNGLYVRQDGAWTFGLTGALPLPSGASTETTLAALSAKLPSTIGQKAAAASLGVVLASDQALPLPAGASTSAAQTTGNTSLASIDTKTPALVNGAVPADTVVRSTSVNRGGTLTTANTAVTLVPSNANRRGLAIQNRNAPGSSYSATTSVFMNCLATATVDFNSLEIPAGALYETPAHHSGTGACSFISATASTPVYVREF